MHSLADFVSVQNILQSSLALSISYGLFSDVDDLSLIPYWLQEPFWFLAPPVIQPVRDRRGNPIADRVRVSWGEMENFKCVDYFKIESYDPNHYEDTFAVSEKANKQVHLLPDV